MRFAALRAPWYKGYLAGGSLLMAGDNAEHAITYWVMWQAFHSPLLAGFAVVAHWLPHLFFAIPFGALADRYDNRRLIQVGLGLFIIASLGWGVLIATDSLQPWHCVILLLVHGFASAIWRPADQRMLFDMVGPTDLPSAVRLMSTGLSVGQLVGPVFGAAALFTVGPALGMFLNIALYLPFLVYLLVTPFNGHGTSTAVRPRLSLRETFSVVPTLPRYPAIMVILVLQGAVGLCIGVALLPLFPEFGEILGQNDSGFGYGLLIVSMAIGAVTGGIGLEAIGRIRASTRLAVGASLVFAICILVFALSRSFPLSVALLIIAGAGTIISESTSLTVVQLTAPEAQRGRFIGVSSVTSLGFRAGSGLLLGLLAGLLGVPTAVAVSASALVVICAVLFAIVILWRRRNIDPDRTVDLAAPASTAAAELAADQA
ncbi:MFS transporter [soil metagenome]